MSNKQFFEENGYLLLRGFYSAAEVAEARAQMRALLTAPEKAHPRVKFSYEADEAGAFPPDPDNPRRVWMVMDTPLAGDWWFIQFQEPRLLDVLVECLGPNLDFHNGKARVKPPGYRSHQGWHQDWPYERHSRPELAAAITYLDDTWEGAATTTVLPGSHLRGEWPHDERTLVPDEAVNAPGVPICARAGDVAIIHVLVLHRAGPNTTPQTRSCIINEYKTHEAVDQWGNSCAFADMPLRREGRPFQI
jgi:phytanoyl-CoA hydroxylase